MYKQYVLVNIYMQISALVLKKNFFQLLVSEEECTLKNKKIGIVQRKVSEKLVTEARVVI